MRKFLSDLDRLLRGGYTRPEDLQSGKIAIPTRSLLSGGWLLGCIYGVFMGLYGATRPETSSVLQLLATTLKVPLLFLLTLTVTFPSLYVFSALAGSRLRFEQTLRLLLAAVAINLALLASLGPVLGFFTLSTQSYPFMVVLNVIIFAASGLAGLVFLRRALVHIFAIKSVEVSPAEPVEGAMPEPVAESHPETDLSQEEADEGAKSLLDLSSEQVSPVGATREERVPIGGPQDPGRVVFRGWLVVYGIVGAQMGWVLRPFIGAPHLPFTWFREREGNFLQGLLDAIVHLFS